MVESLSRASSAQSRVPMARPTPKPTAEDLPTQAASKGDRLLLGNPAAAKTRLDPSLRPTPIPAEGKLDYYQKRHDDFLARYPEAPPSPPSYYLGYGDLYVHRFTLELRPQLSKEGQEWLTRTGKNLQVAIEEVLARNPELELDDEAFTKVAYATHSKAYLDGGLTKLPIGDLIRVAVTPNLADTVNPTGLEVISETAEVVARDKLAAAMDAPEELAQEVLDTIKTSPDLTRDVIRLLNTEENSQALLDGLVKLRAWPFDVSARLFHQLLDVTMKQLDETFAGFNRYRTGLLVD